VRPILEYAFIVWSPYVKSDIALVESAQRKAARFDYNDFSTYSSATSMLTQLDWQSLEERRTNAIIIMFYKVINNLISIDFSHDLKPVLWSSLPVNIVNAPDFNTFCNVPYNFRT